MLMLILTIVAVAVCVILANKKLPIQVVFLSVGLVLAIGITVATQTSVATTTSGNIYLDILESFKEQFVTTFSSVGMNILPIYAYGIYMDKIEASKRMGIAASKPIAKSKNPYFVGIFLAIVLTAIMRIAIVSGIAILVLLMGVLYPVLIRAGVSRQSAAAAIFVGSCFDWGPADMSVVQMLAGIEGTSGPDYFLNVSLKTVPIVVIVVAIASCFIFQAIDKKAGYKLGDHKPAELEGEIECNAPGFYAIFPMLPLFFVVIFSSIFNTGVSITVMTSVTLSILIVFIIELIRKKSAKTCIADLMEWFAALGKGFGNYVTLIVCVQYFAKMLIKLNGFTYLVNATTAAGLNGYVLLVILGLIMFGVNLVLGVAGLPVAVSLAAPAAAVAASLGISAYAAIFPLQMAFGCRCFNLGTGNHTQYMMKGSDSTMSEIFVRCAVPCAIIYVLSFVLSIVVL